MKDRERVKGRKRERKREREGKRDRERALKKRKNKTQFGCCSVKAHWEIDRKVDGNKRDNYVFERGSGFVYTRE